LCALSPVILPVGGSAERGREGYVALNEGTRLPLGLKIFMVGFSLILGVYASAKQGPWTLFYICDVALFLATIGICTERSLPVSMAATGVLVVQGLWVADLLLTALDLSPVRMTGYMLNENVSLIKRVISLFHAWLPLVLLFSIWRLGYDARAMKYWSAVAVVVLLISYFLLPRPPAPADDPLMAVNVNYVFGLYMSRPQQNMPELAWLGGMLVVLPLCFFLPAHLLLKHLFPAARVEFRSRTSLSAPPSP
jgi:hypothetical protein